MLNILAIILGALLLFAPQAYAVPVHLQIPPLIVEESDGSPSVKGAWKIKVTNGTLTQSGAIATLDLSGAGGGVGFGLADPNADRIYFWDDGAGANAFLAPGNSVAITGTTLDTIQDIRTSASPQFTGLTLTNPLVLTSGGTNASLTASTGGIVYSGASAMAILAGTATANQLLLSGSSAAPAWSTATFPATTTVNQLLYSSSANTLAGLATANSGLLVTSGAGVPSIGTDIPTAVTIGTAYVYRAGGTDIALADGGTNASLVASNGGIFYSTATAGAILAGTATANQILMSGSSAAPAWSTATFPATAAGTGTILRADGTNWVATTATYPTTTTSDQLLYSSATNVVDGLATAASGLLVTSGAGVPSIGTDIPTAVTIGGQYVYRVGGTDVAIADGGTGVGSWTNGQLLIGNTTGNTAALATLTGTANQIIVTNGASSITLTTPQDLATASTPQFARLGLGVVADATNVLTATSASTTDLSKAINITHTGAITGTGYGGYFSKTGASTTNVGLYAAASGATNNYAAIFESGNVGIGTATPSGLLNLKGTLSSALTGTVSVTAATAAVTGVGTAFDTELAVGGSIKIGSEIFTVSAIASATALTLDSNHSAGASAVTAYRDPTLFAIDNGDAVNKLTVTRSGNVGIGTAAPTGVLDLGSATSGRGLSWGGATGVGNYANIWTTYGSGDIVLATGMKGSTTADTYLSSSSASQGRAAIRINAYTGTGGSLHFFTDADAAVTLGDTVTPTERMTIDSTGNVGIGTTTGFGTSAVNVISLGAGTAPTTSPANVTQAWTADWNGAGTNALFLRTEEGTQHVFGSNVGIGTTGPGKLLHLSGAGAGGSDIVITDTSQAVDAKNFSISNRSLYLELGTQNDAVSSFTAGLAISRSNGVAIGAYAGVNAPPTNGLIVSGNVGIGTEGPDRLLHPELADATAASVSYAQRLSHIVSTASTGSSDGFGVGLEFELETGTDLTNQISGTIESLWATAANATRKGRLNLYAYDTAARLGLTVEASGAAAMLGFYGVPAVVRPTALTAQLTSITHTAPGTPDYALQNLVQNTGFGFVTADEGNTFLSVVLNLQVRISELETKLIALGLLQ